MKYYLNEEEVATICDALETHSSETSCDEEIEKCSKIELYLKSKTED